MNYSITNRCMFCNHFTIFFIGFDGTFISIAICIHDRNYFCSKKFLNQLKHATTRGVDNSPSPMHKQTHSNTDTGMDTDTILTQANVMISTSISAAFTINDNVMFMLI